MTEVTGAFERIDKFMSNIFKDKKNEFYALLKSCNALVSGGCVTKSLFEDIDINTNHFYQYYNTDIDIYVNSKDVLPLRDFLISQSLSLFPRARASLYCNSFLRRNNIIKVQTYIFANSFNIDLMHVRNKSNPLNVVKNFDLTCCQNYFDGEKVMCLFPELTLQKKMLLNPEYMECLISGNSFTRNRIQKYMRRGFALSLNANLPANAENPYENTSFLGLSINMDNEDEVNTLMKEFVRLIFYHTFFGIKHKMHLTYFFDFANLIKLNEINLNFKNKIINYFRDSSEFFDDSFDSDDFHSLSEYLKISKDKSVTTYTGLYEVIENHEGNPFIETHRNRILTALVDFRGDVDIKDIEQSKYPNLQNRTCYCESEADDIDISTFLRKKNNIIIKYKDIIKGYNRDKLLKFLKNKIRTESNVQITRLYSGENIMFEDTMKLQIKTAQAYSLTNTRYKIGNKHIYSLFPIPLENV